jgi:hypothetical protein
MKTFSQHRRDPNEDFKLETPGNKTRVIIKYYIYSFFFFWSYSLIQSEGNRRGQSNSVPNTADSGLSVGKLTGVRQV